MTEDRKGEAYGTGSALVDDPPRNVLEATGISPAELRVLGLLYMTNPQIAAELHLSPETVKSHVKWLLAKLQVGNRAEAILVATRRGLIR